MIRRLPETIQSLETRRDNLSKLILSVSGWRKVFGADEESLSTELSPVDTEMVAVASVVIGDYFCKKSTSPIIALGRDSRPTGALCEALLLQGLLAAGVEVRLVGLTAVPQVLAYVGESEPLTGFVYITASHNPPGYNGFKIGGASGEVLASPEASLLIEEFKKVYLDDAAVFDRLVRFNSANDDRVTRVLENAKDHAVVARKKYFSRMIAILSGENDETLQADFLRTLTEDLRPHRIKIACDYNGSARIETIDEEILSRYGVEVASINRVVGAFAHRIVPEGESLEPLKTYMSQKPDAFLLGYVPDCDGDRGNLILPIQKNDGSSELTIPDAQFTFALSVISELSFLDLFSRKLRKRAVVANDATSLRIEAIARAFGAEVFRAETGEANVISLAQAKEAEGYQVRILGEGSNGGNITPPGTVRDPLSTLFSILKLIYLRHPKSGKSVVKNAFEKLSLPLPSNDFSPARLLAIFLEFNAGWSTTSVFEKEALFPVRCKNQGLLKKNYESLFAKNWFAREDEVKRRYGFHSYEIRNFEGSKTRLGLGNRTASEDGGFQIVFLLENGDEAGFIWMRGSKTEPVFRVMADVRGARSVEQYLLAWHRAILAEADSLSLAGT